MQSKIILYEPVESQNKRIEDSKLYQKMKCSMNNLEIYVEFFEE